jgi:hypothetical protein
MATGAAKSSTPPSAEVTIPLPPPEKAPGFRDAVSAISAMRAREVADGWLAIAPAEGAGTVYS